MRSRAQYINAILHPKPKPLNQMSTTMDVFCLANQEFINKLQKCKVVARTSKEWFQFVLSETMKQISLLDKDSKETTSIIKKVKSNNEGFEKERNNWIKLVLQIEEIQRFGLQRFQIECPMAGLDDKTLYVIKDCMKQRNESLVQIVSEIK